MNQHLTKATKTIAVSVIDFRYLGTNEYSDRLAESAIILNYGTPEERIIGVQVHGRGEGRKPKTNRAIACGIARSIRRREAAKAARSN